MERELVGLLGAGLTSAASGYGMTVPVGAIDAGYTLIDVLSRECGPQVGAALNTMVQNYWLAWQQSGLSREITQQHAGALPAIVELNRPASESFTLAMQSAQGAPALAAEILERARTSGDVARAGLDEGTAFILLERLFSVIAADQSVLPQVMAAIDLYLRTDLWKSGEGYSQGAVETDPNAPPPLPDPFPVAPANGSAENAAFSRLSPSAIAAVKAGIEMRRPRIAEGVDLEAELLLLLTQLIERLVTLAQRTPEITTPALDAAHHLAGGAFVAADVTLTAAQEILIHLAHKDLGAARKRMQLAAQVLLARATVEEIRLEYRKAARHYASAVRGFTKADTALQWHFLMQQANALFRQNQLFADDAALAEAIRVYDQAGQLDTSLVGGVQWAQGQQRLAEILKMLAHRERVVEYFAKAAYHAGIAANAYAAENREADAIEMRLLQAEALWLGGDPFGDLPMLDASAHAYRTALAAMTKEKSPEEWANATATFGQMLLRAATLRGDPKLLVESIERLRAAVQFADLSNVEIDRTGTETTLGRALLAEYAGGGQVLLLDLAATAFRRAIKSATAEKKMITKAELQHELGMTLWAMAERAGDTQSMEHAVEMLGMSVKSFRDENEDQRADAVQQDLSRLLEAPNAPQQIPVRNVPA
jgi:hypothetical protein